MEICCCGLTWLGIKKCLFLGPILTTWRERKVQKMFFFGRKRAQVFTLEGKKIYGGHIQRITSNKSPNHRRNPKSFLFLPLTSSQIWLMPPGHDHQPTDFTNLEKNSTAPKYRNCSSMTFHDFQHRHKHRLATMGLGCFGEPTPTQLVPW